jgi:hypothetical protein
MLGRLGKYISIDKGPTAPRADRRTTNDQAGRAAGAGFWAAVVMRLERGPVMVDIPLDVHPRKNTILYHTITP